MKYLFNGKVWKQFFNQKRAELMSDTARDTYFILLQCTLLLFGILLVSTMLAWLLGTLYYIWCGTEASLSMVLYTGTFLFRIIVMSVVSVMFIFIFIKWLYKNYREAIEYIKVFCE